MQPMLIFSDSAFLTASAIQGHTALKCSDSFFATDFFIAAAFFFQS